MSMPPVFPEKTTAGITVDPRTLNRIVPESRRADGSIRKEIKIRPGYTPQEDVSRFRGTRQTQMDRNALPNGHIFGWVAPSGGAAKPNPTNGSGSISKSAKKNEKRKEKRDKKKEEIIKANWDDNDVVKGTDDAPKRPAAAKAQEDALGEKAPGDEGTEQGVEKTTDWAIGNEGLSNHSTDELNRQVARLDIGSVS